MAEIKEWKYTNNTSIPTDILNYIPEDSARYYRIVPVSFAGEKLIIGTPDPNNVDAIDAINFISSHAGVPYELRRISEEDFEKVLRQYNDAASAVTEVVSSLDDTLGDQVDELEEKDGEDELNTESAPLVKFVNTILAQAVREGASDIHIEPGDKNSIVRFRVDGDLKKVLNVPQKGHRPLVARIKILCGIRLDEQRRPQDGRFSVNINKRRVDFRVVTMPVSFGEKVVLRILDSTKGVQELESLGLSEYDKEKLIEAISKPYGLILVTGPTGSGKTTTLYSLLSLLPKTTKNIVSLEDPVEYELEGISQSAIRPEIDFSFATGLRSILRADPDIIFVGEIRDKETARLAVQAAFTGHLVFSTIHTNTAVGAITRLIDIGIEPFFIAPTVNLILGQRLLRRLCDPKEEYNTDPSTVRALEEEFKDLPERYRGRVKSFNKFYSPVKSDDCPSGMKGRIGVYETFEIDKEIEKIILSNPTEQELFKSARKKGMITMYEDAIIKASEGIIPFQEASRLNILDKEDIGEFDEDVKKEEKEEKPKVEEKKVEPKLMSENIRDIKL